MDFSRRGFIGASALGAAMLASAAAKRSKTAAGSGDADRDALDAYADLHRAAWGIPGVTIAVTSRDGEEWLVQSGLADVDKNIPVGPQHLFQIGSISKMFTALAAWSLIDEGKLSPDVKLVNALNGVTVRGGEAITLQHLLNHQSGLPADSTIFPEGGLWTGFAPGTNWSYSNCGYDLAGRIAAAASEREFTELVTARVLEKIGMADSVVGLRVADRARHAQGYEPALTDRLNPKPGPMTPTPWVDSDSPAGAIAATPADMAKFIRFLLGVADGKGGGVFSDEAAKSFLADPVDGWGPNSKYGNGVARIETDGRKYLHHTGGMVSFCSAMHVDVEAGVGAFVSSNIHYSLNYRPNRIAQFACELMRAKKEGAARPTPKPPTIALEKPAQYASVFTAADGDKFAVEVEGDNLVCARGERRNPMQQASGPLFATTEPDFAITGIVIETENEKPVRAWIGEKEYLVDVAIGYKPPAPQQLRVLAGRYDNDDRWGGPLYVYARDAKLFIGNVEELTPLKKGAWRLGDETSPERVTFGGVINGQPQLLMFSGVPFVRRFG